MNKNSGKKLLFLEPISSKEPDNMEVLDRLVKLLGQHGVEVIDDMEMRNEIHDQENSD
jgi:hypothetical protein